MVSQITCVICARGTSTEKGDSSSRLLVSERLFPTTDEWLPPPSNGDLVLKCK